MTHNVTLDLTHDEAAFLRRLLDSHVNGPLDGPRRHMQSILAKVEKTRVPGMNMMVRAQGSCLWVGQGVDYGKDDGE
jgi:hypothetical protein